MRTWIFGDNIDTDVIVPGRYLAESQEELAKHLFEPIILLFAQNVRRGDIIVAGRNFGCGSSREQAASGLKYVGIYAVIAESFARIFFRNCISIGLPAIICKEVGRNFHEGDEAEFLFREAYLKNLTTGRTVKTVPLPPFILSLIERGGILSMLKEKYST